MQFSCKKYKGPLYSTGNALLVFRPVNVKKCVSLPSLMTWKKVSYITEYQDPLEMLVLEGTLRSGIKKSGHILWL